MEKENTVTETNRLESTPGLEAMNAMRFRIPGDKVKQATAHYSEEAKAAVWWAASYCRNNNLSVADLAAKLRKPSGETYSADTLDALFKGRREADEVGKIVSSIESFRRIADERANLAQSQFVETSLVKAVHRVCRMAFLRKKITFIFGDSQIGKTAALEDYARKNNHGQTIMIRMPTGGSYAMLVIEMARVLNISSQIKLTHLRQRIFDTFDDSMLLIVDECHQTMMGTALKGMAALEFLREIHDRKKCGVVLCGTNIFRDGITRGPQSKMLQQLYRRSYSPLQLPDKPTQGNLNDFAESFGLDPAPDRVFNVKVGESENAPSFQDNPHKLQTEVVAKHGLGRWLNILQEASDDAREDGKKITWGRVLLAHKRVQSMETFLEAE